MRYFNGLSRIFGSGDAGGDRPVTTLVTTKCKFRCLGPASASKASTQQASRIT
jgi:hypothetical protein